MRLLIIGGGAAGATAAQFARKQDRDAEIILFEGSDTPQYSRCGLPHALSGEIPSFENLIEFSTDWFHRIGIDLRLSTNVRSIDAIERRIAIEGPNGKGEESYDSLILATGSRSSIPKIEGMDCDGRLLNGIFHFKGMHDAKRVKQWCSGEKRRFLVIGAGLVGLEVAEAARRMGHEVTVVEFLSSILPTMVDPDIAEPMMAALTRAGVRAITSASVKRIIGSSSVEHVEILLDGEVRSETVGCDSVVIATGQRPASEIAVAAGCALGGGGHLIVDARCETSVKGIFSAGDCCEYPDFITGVSSPVGTGTLAVKMGEVAGRNSSGGNTALPRGFLNSRVTKIFGVELAAVGPTSSAMTKSSIGFVQARVKGSTLPVYYPGGKDLIVKLACSPEDGRLLSCQISGEREAAMRADIIGACILGGLTVQDLSMLETAYAPSVAPCVDVLTAASQALLMKLKRAK